MLKIRRAPVIKAMSLAILLGLSLVFQSSPTALAAPAEGAVSTPHLNPTPTPPPAPGQLGRPITTKPQDGAFTTDPILYGPRHERFDAVATGRAWLERDATNPDADGLTCDTSLGSFNGLKVGFLDTSNNACISHQAYEVAARFDLSKIQAIPKKVITHATLEYDEVAGHPGCVWQIGLATSHWSDQQRTPFLNEFVDQGHDNNWDATQAVARTLAFPSQYDGFVFIGRDESSTTISDSCLEVIDHIRLVIDYTVIH